MIEKIDIKTMIETLQEYFNFDDFARCVYQYFNEDLAGNPPQHRQEIVDQVIKLSSDRNKKIMLLYILLQLVFKQGETKISYEHVYHWNIWLR